MRRWLKRGIVLVLIFVGLPFAIYSYLSWQSARELHAIFAELDAKDALWRWHDLLAAKCRTTPTPIGHSGCETRATASSFTPSAPRARCAAPIKRIGRRVVRPSCTSFGSGMSNAAGRYVSPDAGTAAILAWNPFFAQPILNFSASSAPSAGFQPVSSARWKRAPHQTGTSACPLPRDLTSVKLSTT